MTPLLNTGPLSHSIDDYPSGIVLPIDKPYRWTSADVIRKIKYAAIRHFGKKNLKVGHAGTLDPLATGILIVCIGNATKRAQELQDSDKEYVAGIAFGATTPSYDREKEIDARFPLDGVSEEALRSVLPSFLGEQDQVAPLFSAKSVDGIRAYERARKLYKAGKPLSEAEGLLNTSRIKISGLELLSFDPLALSGEPTREDLPASAASSRINVIETSGEGLLVAKVRIACSKGTYIRAFARDLGEALGSGAFLDSLCRTRSGNYIIEDALSLEDALKLFV